jgi:plastocyanin
MRPFARALAVLSTTLLLAACSGGGGSPTAAPATGGGSGATTPAAATQAATQGAAGSCATASGAGSVAASIENRTFVPASINAKVGDVISWTNADSVPHGIALDDGGAKCTDTISGGATGSTAFSAAGTYAFHCFVHPSMKGTIVIS